MLADFVWESIFGMPLILIVGGLVAIAVIIWGGQRAMFAGLRKDRRRSGELFTCPCCGYRTLNEPPGSYEICEVCFWEDDHSQLIDPADRDGANSPLSLMECQTNYLRLGVSEARFLDTVRSPEAHEVRDAEWRPAQESDLRWVRQLRDLSPEEYGRVETWVYWKRKAT